MRLSEQAIRTIITTVGQLAPDAKVYLFGSRTDDTKRGGDIDLLVVTESPKPLEIKGQIWSALQRGLGEQKIDVVVARPDSEDAFVRYIFQEAVELV